MSTILVQMADDQWTQLALHLACAMAWQYEAAVVLLRLVPVPHPGWLGAHFSESFMTGQDSTKLQEYAAIAEDYGVDFIVQPMQYFTLDGALVEAADQLDATVVFAKLPQSIIPLVDKLRWWSLARQLAAHKRQLYSFNQPIDTTPWTPSVTTRLTSK